MNINGSSSHVPSTPNTSEAKESLNEVSSLNEDINNTQHPSVCFRSNIRIRPFLPDDIFHQEIQLGNKVFPTLSKRYQQHQNQEREKHSVFKVEKGVNGVDVLILKPELATVSSSSSSSSSPSPLSKKSNPTQPHDREFVGTDENMETKVTHSVNGRLKKRKDKYEKFPFDTIFDTHADQPFIYEKLAKPMVDDLLCHQTKQDRAKSADGANHHVLLSIGVSNSGKTYTLMGDIQHYSTALPEWESIDTGVEEFLEQKQIGVVPRILIDVFSRSRSKANFVVDVVQLSMIQVYNDSIIDLYSSTNDTSKKTSYSFSSSPTIRPVYNKQLQVFELKPPPVTRSANDLAQALKYLTIGLERVETKVTNLNRNGSSRGHTIIFMKFISARGGHTKRLTVVDLAGIERIKKSHVVGSALRESISINESIGAVLGVLRALKENNSKQYVNGSSTGAESKISSPCQNTENLRPNVADTKNSSKTGLYRKGSPTTLSTSVYSKQQVVPYRQCTLTMVLQPIFSGYTPFCATVITLLVSVYPGEKDYCEKRALLHNIHSLRGLSIPSSILQPSGRNSFSSYNSDQSMSQKIDTPTGQKQRGKKKSPIKKISSVLKKPSNKLLSTAINMGMGVSPRVHQRFESNGNEKNHAYTMFKNDKHASINVKKEQVVEKLTEEIIELKETNKLLVIKNKILEKQMEDFGKGGVPPRKSLSITTDHPFLPLNVQNHLITVQKCNESRDIYFSPFGGNPEKESFPLIIPEKWQLDQENALTSIMSFVTKKK